MSSLNRSDIVRLYGEFNAPLCKQDCGKRCAPHNEGGHPFCCDTRHAVPTAYATEWEYLKNETDLWHLWQGETHVETARLADETPQGSTLIECLGSEHCQRDYRSITCRAFPFFPYIDSRGEFLGMTYYDEYRDRCWIISHLDDVTPEFRKQFIRAYEYLFARIPEEQENFSVHSAETRRIYSGSRRRIHLLHRNGKTYAISPHSEMMEEIPLQSLPRFGLYKLIADLAFPDEHDQF